MFECVCSEPSFFRTIFAAGKVFGVVLSSQNRIMQIIITMNR